MSRRPHEFAQQWLKKARHDLLAADTLIKLQDSPLDVVAFHCQQAVEKGLKGLLSSKEVKFQRTHDLDELLDAALPYLPELAPWRNSLSVLTQFAVDVRYPGTAGELSRSVVEKALGDAWGVFTLVERATLDTNPSRTEDRIGAPD
jgi:HEPN domain-containing protein